MERILLLFDIDGTLMKSGGLGMQAMFRVADDLFGQGFRWDGIDAGGHLDPLIFAEAAAINGLDDDPAHHQRFHDAYIAELERHFRVGHPDIQTMPGVHPLFDHLRQREAAQGDVLLGLLTGNYTKAVPIKLNTIGVDTRWFGITAYGDEAANRPALVALSMHKYQAMMNHPADPRGVIVIGDTPRDVACAKAHGAKVLAVATGGYEVDQLMACGADMAVQDLADPQPLFTMIEESRQAIRQAG